MNTQQQTVNELHYFPKELSWLSFNERVLQEAADERNPLIERLRFLGIYSNNMDEFYRVRVADVKRRILLKKYQSSETTQRCFCGECASPIISIKTDTPDTYRLRIGTLDTPLEHKPTKHIFTAYKAEWDTICDGLPQYDERP